MSFKVTFVAFEPLFALLTVIVQTTMSPTKTSSSSTVLLTDTSVYGTGVIVSLTVLLNPLGAISVILLVKFPSALTQTFTIIVAFVNAGIFVTVHEMVWPSTIVSPICSAPIMATVPLYSNPSGKLSITIKLCVYVSLPVFLIVKLYST